MSVSETPTSLYCLNCGASKQIFLSTPQEEITAFRQEHIPCLRNVSLRQAADPFQQRDWKLRGSQSNEHEPK